MFKRLLSTITVTVCMTSIFLFGICSCENFLVRVEPPIFSLPDGIYSGSQNITITCATPGAKIHISVIHPHVFDENSKSWTYYGPIKVDSTTIIMAKAYKRGMISSPNVHCYYTINYPNSPLPTPKFSKKDGIYITPQTIIISCLTTSATIRYTTDGSEPTEASTLYNGSITINETTFFKAKAFKIDYPESVTANGSFTIISSGKLQDIDNK
jgi:chitinase